MAELCSSLGLPEKHGLFGRLPDWFGSGLVFQVASSVAGCAFSAQPAGGLVFYPLPALYQTVLLG